MKKILLLLMGIAFTFSLVGCSCSKEFTVTFDSDGGSPVESQTVNLNGTATEPEEPTKEGYTFNGWLLDDEPFDFSNKITEDITLVASWIEGSGDITIEFEVDGTMKKMLIESGQTLTRPEDPVKEGYEFLGWYLDGELFDFSTEITENITLEARFAKIEETTLSTAKRFTVTFDSNGGSSIFSQTVIEGSTVKKPENPTKEGYTFVSWQLNGKDYDFSTKVTSNLTLVAKWEKNEDVYSLKFTKYDEYTPAGTLQVLKNGEIIEFSELLDVNGTYVGKYNAKEKGMLNANSYVVNKVSQVKLIDGTIVNVK